MSEVAAYEQDFYDDSDSGSSSSEGYDDVPTSLLPISSYNLKLDPYSPSPAIEEEYPVTIRITLAAIDPDSPIDDEEKPSTLRVLKRANPQYIDYEDLVAGSDEEDSESEEEEEKPKSKKGKKAAATKEDELSEDDDEDEEDDVAEFVLCTLSPKVQFQQSLDLTINPREEVMFVATGSYPIHLSGNYIIHPFDDESTDDELYDESSDEDDEQDLSPDEDEVINNLDEDEIMAKVEELKDDDDDDEEEEEEEEEEEVKPEPKVTKKSKKEAAKEAKKSSKRSAEEPTEKPSKKAKKSKDEKKDVQFNKNLEKGPTGKRLLTGGVSIEDKKVGDGPIAKKNSKVGVRYIGKLSNGKVFDSNTKGKPFYFTLGKGEVIKGWDVGVSGMKTAGERRIVIPASMAYGKKALPGIPANSELTFDVKLVNVK